MYSPHTTLHPAQFALTHSGRLVALHAAHAKVMCQIDHKTWELTSLALLVSPTQEAKLLRSTRGYPLA